MVSFDTKGVFLYGGGMQKKKGGEKIMEKIEQIAYDAGYEGRGSADAPRWADALRESPKGQGWEIWARAWREGRADRAEEISCYCGEAEDHRRHPDR